MTVECINPDDLPTPETYTQVVVATGSKLVFVSGQEPEDIHGELVGHGDLAAQARQMFANLGRALAGAGARPAQVTRITIDVVNHKREYLPISEEARAALFGAHKPADLLVGIATLSHPDYRIEVDAIAVIDHTTESSVSANGDLLIRVRAASYRSAIGEARVHADENEPACHERFRSNRPRGIPHDSPAAAVGVARRRRRGS